MRNATHNPVSLLGLFSVSVGARTRWLQLYVFMALIMSLGFLTLTVLVLVSRATLLQWLDAYRNDKPLHNWIESNHVLVASVTSVAALVYVCCVFSV